MEKKDTADSLSTQKHLSSVHNPGWNDPPKWAFTGTQNTSATPTKRVLNKRVAFPLSSTQTTDKASPSQLTPKSLNMPPPLQSPINSATVSHSPSIPSSDKEIDGENDDLEVDKVQVLNDTLANLQGVINEHILERSQAEEIQKRLDVMRAAWLEDKLNISVHRKVLLLSKALQEGNIEQADQIHIELMMQHSSLCSAWIPGIRHIILGLKAKCQSSDAIQVKDPLPHLLPIGEGNVK